MSLPKMTTAVDNISKLDTRPNAVNGLTADQLKAEFDKGPEAIKKFLNEVLIPALDGAITLDALGAVPVTRKVARKALSEDILLDASDIDYDGTIDGTRVQGDLGDAIDMISMKLGETVPKTRTVNGKTLDKDITLTAGAIEYAGTASGSDVAAALDGLAAKKAVALVTVTATDDGAAADLTLSQIVDAYNTGREVKCLLVEGSNSTLLSLLKISSTVARFYGQTSATAGRAVTFTQSGSIGVTQVKAGAANVEYSGKVGSDAVADVAEALDGLAVGKPLDMTADYVASGAESVGQWIAMAATGSTTEYRVPCGTFLLRGEDSVYGMTIVTIFEEPVDNYRGAIERRFTADCDWVITVWEGVFVGQSPAEYAMLSISNTGALELKGVDNLDTLVPVGNTAHKGKFLMCNASGGAEWASLPTYDGGVS